MLHFKKGDYDYFRYGSKFRKIGQSSYEEKKERIFFDLIAEKVPSVDLEFMLAAIFFERPKTFVGDILSKECQEIYLRRKGVRDGLSYTWKQDLMSLKIELRDRRTSMKEAIELHNDPLLFRLYRYKVISCESMIIFNKIFNVFSRWDGKINDTLVYPRERDRLKKYAPFLGTININESIKHLKETYVDNR